ncbi:hypothetical protein BBF93_14755 [Hyphomonas sp. CACIAM 19H1]|uniref:endonuclease domain-containing protein n=1 Tax=Hyphomonas sp. CACIAM 19H1 TaxID=1873716 RepID=UPI000DEDBA2C|nr:hypothetical protein BBF93_14755 [Hyphomonas sp. CACIAM 19H1]
MSRRPIIHSARRLRQSANAPEDIAWQALRELRKYGYAVRRQHPIGPYIVDFAIQKAMLVIEIDGGIHNLDTVQLRDDLRQADLELRGWLTGSAPSPPAPLPRERGDNAPDRVRYLLPRALPGHQCLRPRPGDAQKQAG